MAVSRKKKGGRPEVVAEVDGFEFTVLVDPRPQLSDIDLALVAAELDSSRRQKLQEVCDQLSLSMEARERLLRVVCELIERRKVEPAGGARKAKEDAEEIKEIAALARQLADRLDQLPANLKMMLVVSCQQLVDESLPEEWQLRYQEGCGFVAPLDILSGGADMAAAAFGDSLTSGGRKPVLDHHGWHVLDVWRAVEDQGLNPARGSFLRLCDVVFDVVGFPSGAEGAVRYFASNLAWVMPESVEGTMRMLDRIEAADKTDEKRRRKNPQLKQSN